jgi:NAD(P)-dependent dehydrogenase (short-subunit alcohol dehydrogenase family)
MHETDAKQFDLAGKVALVTGASGGLGAQFAKVLCRNGASVIAAARREDRLKALAEDCAELSGTIHPVAMDVTDSDSITRAFDETEKHFGTIEILVNNAGVADRKSLMKIDMNSWDWVQNTNLRAAWEVAQESARRLLAAGKPGSIINITSIYGVGVGVGNAAYATSKAGLIQMTRSMALELSRKGIRVNNLSPGYFRTELDEAFFDSEAGRAYFDSLPMQRPGNLDELNGALLLLASDAGSFISGSNLVVDGGHLVKSL